MVNIMSKKIIWESDFARASERAINEEKLILIDFFDPT